jgi:ribosomal-protein-alanine N-acetyltransferase
MKYDVRFLEEDDIPAILEIERDSFPAPWSESTFRREIENPNAFFFVAAGEDETVLGYYDMWIYAGEGHLLNICVARAYRRKGLGENLLRHAISLAKESGVPEVFLEVRTSNDAAIRLYEKYGFEEISVRKGYYLNGEDALVYVLRLGGEG